MQKNLPTPRRAGIYVRVSQDRDGASESPTRQADDCRALCARNGWQVVRVYEDRDISAYSGKQRPGYKALVDDLASGAIDAIVVWKLDRLTRRFTKIAEVVQVLEKTGAVLVSVNDSIDTSTAMGKGVLGLMAAMAESESESTSKRVRRAVESSIARGDMPRGGTRCFGYTKEGTVDEGEAKALREMVALFLGGTNFRQIGKRLNERGVRTAKDGLWSAMTVGQILRSPRIGGYRLSADKNDLVSGNWKPIIPREDFALLREALANVKPGRTSNEIAHVFTGLVVCGRCGCRMYVGKWRQPHAGNREFRKYACVKDIERKNCGGVSASYEAVNRIVQRDLAGHVMSLKRASPKGRSTAAMQKDLSMYESRREELVSARYVERSIDEEDFKKAKEALDERIMNLRAAIDRVSSARTGVAAMHLRDIDRWWTEASLRDQRALVHWHIERIVIHPARHRGGNVFDPDRVEIIWKQI